MATIYKLENQVDEIAGYRQSIKELETKIAMKKAQLVKDMTELNINTVTTELGKAEIVDYEIGTIHKGLVNTALREAKEKGLDFTADDCKVMKRINTLIVKRHRGI
nr:MAG: hypothetical protein [Bacteriophage sp.]